MPVEHAAQNSVVVANLVNPSILTPRWLMEQQIIPADTVRGGAIIASQLVQLDTEDYEFMAIPDRLQFTPKCAPERQGGLVAQILGGIVRALPHTPYTAVGLNLHYKVSFPEMDFGLHTRHLLMQDNPISQRFQGDQTRCGAYYSRYALGFRLKLTIMPIITDTAPELGDALSLHFNFHKDLRPEDDKCREVADSLAKWDEARTLANEMALSLT